MVTLIKKIKRKNGYNKMKNISQKYGYIKKNSIEYSNPFFPIF